MDTHPHGLKCVYDCSIYIMTCVYIMTCISPASMPMQDDHHISIQHWCSSTVHDTKTSTRTTQLNYNRTHMTTGTPNVVCACVSGAKCVLFRGGGPTPSSGKKTPTAEKTSLRKKSCSGEKTQYTLPLSPATCCYLHSTRLR